MPIQKYLFQFLVLSSFVVASGCKEQCAVIPPLKPPTLGERKVLIEEFTGVRCVNCPDGSLEIENLRALYGENLVAVSIHAGFFAKPYPNQKDYSIKEGKEIIAYLGDPIGYPSAVVDRKLFTGQTSLQLGKNQWAGFIQQESQKDPAISLNVKNTYKSDTRDLSVNVTLTPLTPIGTSIYLSIMITENGIIGPQLTPQGLKDDYVHKHMLRAMLTPYDGDRINGNTGVGNVITKNYSFKLPDDFKAENCKVVAFVHYNETGRKEVLQAEEKNLAE